MPSVIYGETVGFVTRPKRLVVSSFRAVFHLAEFSARNDIFFCLLTPTLSQVVFKQKKYRSARKIPPSGKWPLRRIVQKRGGKVFHHKLGISYTILRQEFIEHLSPFIDDVKKFVKSGGASNPALRNVNGELLDRHVRWKNSKSKRRYAKFRTEDLLSVTEAMGI